MNQNNFTKYMDLLTITKVNEKSNQEEFVFLPKEDDKVVGVYRNKSDMLEFGDYLPVRKTVYEKLKSVAENLQCINTNCMLRVVYGFRAMEVQKKYFSEIYDKVKNEFHNEIALYEYIHEKVAVPSVAGHPTGGAVDIEIINKTTNESLDFGSEILDWDSSKCYYVSDSLSKEERANRELLRKVMMQEGFAPYDGEWWHFSYGDKEWAFYYHKEEALYHQVDARTVYEKKR